MTSFSAVSGVIAPPACPAAAAAAVNQAIVEAAGLNAAGDKKRQIVVTGCLAQRYGDSLAADLPEADLVMGFQAYGNLPAALADRLGVHTAAAAAAAAAAGSSSSSSSSLPIPSSSGRVQVG